MIFRIQDNKAVVMDTTGGPETTWEDLMDHLPDSEPRFVVYDHRFQSQVSATPNPRQRPPPLPRGGREWDRPPRISESPQDGCRFNKLVFIFWAPEPSSVRSKMLYSAGKDALRRNLPGVTVEMQACDLEEMSLEEVDKRVRSITQGA